ncbi:MAG: DUF3592 domain-containing protein [Polyangiaceae bacterium]
MNTQAPAHDIERIARDFKRWRTIFLAIAVVLPALLFALFERQARRLDDLGAHGVVVQATVTSISRQGSITYVDYAYEVEGTTYTWNVAQDEAPYAPGETFPIVVSPKDPSLSRPGTDPSRGTTEAAKNRSFTRTAVFSLFAFLSMCAFGCHWRLQRLRATGRTEANDPVAYRNRLIFSAVLLAPFFIAILVFNINDAKVKGGRQHVQRLADRLRRSRGAVAIFGDGRQRRFARHQTRGRWTGGSNRRGDGRASEEVASCRRAPWSKQSRELWLQCTLNVLRRLLALSRLKRCEIRARRIAEFLGA